jgi:hypothetical protein
VEPLQEFQRNQPLLSIILSCVDSQEVRMKKYLFATGIVFAIAAPALADDVGVRVAPAPGVTIGETHDRDRTTVIKKHEPESKTVIKKEDEFGNREKTVIHHDRD